MTDEYIHEVHEKFLTIPTDQWFSVQTKTLGNIQQVLELLSTKGHSIAFNTSNSTFRRLSTTNPYQHLTNYNQWLTEPKISIEKSVDNEWDEWVHNGRTMRARIPPRIVVKLDGKVIGIESIKK